MTQFHWVLSKHSNINNNGQGLVSLTLARTVSRFLPDINLEDHLIYQNNVISKLLEIILDQPAGKCLEINII